MTLEEALRAVLLSDATVAALVGDRIMPDIAIAQLTAFPNAVFSRLNAGEDYDLDGDAYREIARIEYSCIDVSWKGARGLLEAMRTKAIATRGVFNGITIASIFVADIREQGFSKLTNCYQIDLDLEVHRIL